MFGKMVFLSLMFLAFVGLIFSAFSTEITVTNPKGPYETVPVDADFLDIAWIAAATDVVDTTFAATGRELLLLYYAGPTVAYVTLESQPDQYERLGSVNNYELSAGDYAAFWFGNVLGWRDEDTGAVAIQSSTENVTVSVIRIPE